MSATITVFQEFKEKSKIHNASITHVRKNDEFLLYISCLQKDINIKNEQKRLINSWYKHGRCWQNYVFTAQIVFSLKKRQILFFHCINFFSEEYFLVFLIFFRKQKKAMEKVEVIEISSQLGAIQEICEFVERVHNI